MFILTFYLITLLTLIAGIATIMAKCKYGWIPTGSAICLLGFFINHPIALTYPITGIITIILGMILWKK